MTENKENGKSKTEEFKLAGSELLDKIKELIHESNIRRLIIKNEEGKTIMEVPLTLGIVGAALAPVLAAVGAMCALVAKFTLVVEKYDDEESKEESAEKEVEKK
jgi:hypothetical protein